MSDFCRNCEPESEDLSGITTLEGWQQGLAAVVLCEGCEAVQVDLEGYCLGDCKPYGEPSSHSCRHCKPQAKCLFHQEGSE